MKKISHPRIKIIFIVGTVLLLTLSVFSYLRINNLIFTSSIVNHTNVVKLELESLFSQLNGMESSQRGYLLTKNKLFLNEFNAKLHNVNRQVKEIKMLTADNYSQQRNIDTMTVLLDKRIQYMVKVLKDGEREKILTERWMGGKRIMDDLRRHIDKMMDEEDLLLRLRTKSLTKATALTPLFTILLMICSIMVLLLSYYGINRELKISNQFKSDLESRKKELLDANTSLQKSNQELESFTYISSHDLQEPLRKIQTFITRIMEKESDNLSDSGKNYLNRTQESANRMQTLIRDLLAYSRLNADIFPVEITDLNVIVAEIRDDLEEEIIEKNVTIDVVGNHKVKIIVSQFRQLLMNLISNSIKFSNAEIAPHIIIKSSLIKGKDVGFENISPLQEYSCITITDNGIGFDSQYRSRIFEVFQRLHIDQQYVGTGIGLAIVKKIVDNHNGYITADGETGKGAVFTIYIPD